MKNLFVMLCTLLSSVSFVSSVYAQPFTANVTIAKTITVTQQTALNFGKIVITDAGADHDVTMEAGGVITPGSGFSVKGTPSEGTFEINGDKNTQVHVTVNGGSLSPSDQLIKDKITLSVSVDGNADVSLDSNGDGTVRVIGTITIPENAAPSDYSGSYEVTVSY